MTLLESVSIRRAQGSDFPAVDRLFSTSYPILLREAYDAETCVKALPIIGRAQPDLVRSGSFFLVLRGALLVGAGGWTLEAPGTGDISPDTGHVRHVVTHHRHQRHGVGRRLLDYIMLHAQGQGVRRLCCYSTLNAVPFYAAMGFKAERDVTLPLAGSVPFPAVRMSATL